MVKSYWGKCGTLARPMKRVQNTCAKQCRFIFSEAFILINLAAHAAYCAEYDNFVQIKFARNLIFFLIK
jgi:hypothetical protein